MSTFSMDAAILLHHRDFYNFNHKRATLTRTEKRYFIGRNLNYAGSFKDDLAMLLDPYSDITKQESVKDLILIRLSLPQINMTAPRNRPLYRMSFYAPRWGRCENRNIIWREKEFAVPLLYAYGDKSQKLKEWASQHTPRSNIAWECWIQRMAISSIIVNRTENQFHLSCTK